MTITLPWWFPIPGLIIAIFAAILAVKNYRRKSGLQIRGNFQIASDMECSDKYVSQITIENIKDRAVTVFAIYLRVGHRYFIELENFENKPMILKAYETYHKVFGPIQFYGSDWKRLNLNKILSDQKIKKRLILATGDGKYTIPKPIKIWNPVILYFQNLMTAIIEPKTLMLKDKYIGSNVKFIVTVELEEGNEEVLLLAKNEYLYDNFKGFRLTPEALENQSTLNEFLQRQIEAGNIQSKNITVIETTEWTSRYADYYGPTFEAEHLGWFSYYVKARFLTWARYKRQARLKAKKSDK